MKIQDKKGKEMDDILKKENVYFNPDTNKLTVNICLRVDDFNGEILKAKVKLYMDIIDGAGGVIDGVIDDFVETYRLRTPRKVMSSLDRAFAG